MSDSIKLEDIYDKNINFLIGAGASSGLFPTLALEIKDEYDKNHTIETLATKFDAANQRELHTLLFMHYFQKCIHPVMSLDIPSLKSGLESNVIDNYEKFIKTILVILSRKRTSERRCNIFTTNYDGCFALTADRILNQRKQEFIINDGTRGFRKKYLQARNFNSFIYQAGIFDQHHTDIPQINIIHLHGSVYWEKEDENIVVDYSRSDSPDLIGPEVKIQLAEFSSLLESPNKSVADLEHFVDWDLDQLITSTAVMDEFWAAYKKLPVVNPTKWKFHETVFEEHYYQMLRSLSYELEKPNTVFITFGFSFSDEHILNLVKRSLSNPKLQIFVCCFNEQEKISMEEKFSGYNNVQFVSVLGRLDFKEFNDQVFTLEPKISELGSSK